MITYLIVALMYARLLWHANSVRKYEYVARITCTSLILICACLDIRLMKLRELTVTHKIMAIIMIVGFASLVKNWYEVPVVQFTGMVALYSISMPIDDNRYVYILYYAGRRFYMYSSILQIVQQAAL